MIESVHLLPVLSFVLAHPSSQCTDVLDVLQGSLADSEDWAPPRLISPFVILRWFLLYGQGDGLRSRANLLHCQCSILHSLHNADVWPEKTLTPPFPRAPNLPFDHSPGTLLPALLVGVRDLAYSANRVVADEGNWRGQCGEALYGPDCNG